MVMHRCPHCQSSLTWRPDQRLPPTLYTPTMDGFERFIRDMVGLHDGTSEWSLEGDGTTEERRKGG
jgi:hypothetical protein